MFGNPQGHKTDATEVSRQDRVRSMTPMMLAMTSTVDLRDALDASDTMWAELDALS